ncbi:MAG: DedA family protein [Alphaproteobacteria bacterium]|nr:DedA family protein [Alphaproteobacteria bacterium]
MLRGLYDWVMSLASGRYALPALAVISFVESSFFPIPPDVMLIPMVVAKRQAWWRIALVCTIASVLGALLGYAIGAFLFETLGSWLLDVYHAHGTFERLVGWYDQWGWIGILAGAITPLPYKVLTIFSGTVAFSLPVFVAVSILGRGLRFFLVAGLLYWFGEPIKAFIERRLTLVFVAFMVLLIGGFVVISMIK